MSAVEPGAGAVHAIDPWVRALLRCPATGAELVDGWGPTGEAELHSAADEGALAYPVRDGIPVLLVEDARPLSSH